MLPFLLWLLNRFNSLKTTSFRFTISASLVSTWQLRKFLSSKTALERVKRKIWTVVVLPHCSKVIYLQSWWAERSRMNMWRRSIFLGQLVRIKCDKSHVIIVMSLFSLLESDCLSQRQYASERGIRTQKTPGWKKSASQVLICVARDWRPQRKDSKVIQKLDWPSWDLVNGALMVLQVSREQSLKDEQSKCLKTEWSLFCPSQKTCLFWSLKWTAPFFFNRLHSVKGQWSWLFQTIPL